MINQAPTEYFFPALFVLCGDILIAQKLCRQYTTATGDIQENLKRANALNRTPASLRQVETTRKSKKYADKN
ncbi:MAG: hypothetical protein HY089_00640 [Ignavibacteriales bacterium]|nr:hypothetical protein [Ignavibacteriales bacterium]